MRLCVVWCVRESECSNDSGTRIAISLLPRDARFDPDTVNMHQTIAAASSSLLAAKCSTHAFQPENPPSHRSAGATNCTAAQLAELPNKGCAIKSGDAAAAARGCQLALPCMGRFTIK